MEEEIMSAAPDVLRGEDIPEYVKKHSSTEEWPNGIRGEKGFYPYVPEELMIKYYQDLLKDVDFSKIHIGADKVLAVRLPVYPMASLEYRYKKGSFTLNTSNNGIIFRGNNELLEHYIPLPKKNQGPYFSDFKEPLFKFFTIKSNIDWVPNNSIFYFRNDVTFNRIIDLSFQYAGVEFTILAKDNLLFAKEI